MTSSYFFYGSILEKCGNFWKNGRFSGRIWPDWGNTTWADMAGLGSIGIIYYYNYHSFELIDLNAVHRSETPCLSLISSHILNCILNDSNTD